MFNCKIIVSKLPKGPKMKCAQTSTGIQSRKTLIIKILKMKIIKILCFVCVSVSLLYPVTK